MKKLITILLILAFILTLGSCNKKEEQYVDTIFKATPPISKIELLDVPKDPIEIGHFSERNIKIKATYINGDESIQLLTEELFPESDLNEFKTPGEKYFDLVYKGNHIPLRFTLVEPKTTTYLRVQFKDLNDNLLYTRDVKYLSSAVYGGKIDDLNYYKNDKYYKFNGKWSESLDHVYRSMTVYPLYDEYEIQDSYDNYNLYRLYDKIASFDKDDEHNILLYLGRVNNATLDILDTYERTEYKDENITFDLYDETENWLIYKMFAENISKNLIYKNYYHENVIPYWYGSLYNPTILNFNLSNTKEVLNDSLERTDSYRFPYFFGERFEDFGYKGSELVNAERYDGLSSLRSLFNNNDYEPRNEYLKENANVFKFTEDYPLGYYQMVFEASLDVYINVRYKDKDLGIGYPCYELLEVNFAFAFIPNSFKFKINYSKTNEFKTYGEKLVISNAVLASTLDQYAL